MTDAMTREQRRGRWRRLWHRLRGVVLVLLIVIVVGAALRLTVLRPPRVAVAAVQRGDVPAEVEGTGTVTADVLADIAARITGRVERVYVDEGDAVHKGQIVAILDQTGLRHQVKAARAELASAKATAAERRREWDRERGLVQTGAVGVEESQRYRERLAVARSAVRAAEAELGAAAYRLSLTRIPSLVSGLVTRRRVVPGASVVPGQTMFTVADTRLIYVDTHVDQNFTGQLRKGETATVILRGREDRPLAGRVLRMSPQADAATEETVAEVSFTLPLDEFQLGQWANVYIRVGEAMNALIVPQAALMPMDDREFVFVVGPGDELRREPVKVLARSPRLPRVAVAGHLRMGERVVLMPMGLRPGEKVRPVPAAARRATAMPPL